MHRPSQWVSSMTNNYLPSPDTKQAMKTARLLMAPRRTMDLYEFHNPIDHCMDHHCERRERVALSRDCANMLISTPIDSRKIANLFYTLPARDALTSKGNLRNRETKMKIINFFLSHLKAETAWKVKLTWTVWCRLPLPFCTTAIVWFFITLKCSKSRPVPWGSSIGGKFGFGMRIFSTISVPSVYSGRKISAVVLRESRIFSRKLRTIVARNCCENDAFVCRSVIAFR